MKARARKQMSGLSLRVVRLANKQAIRDDENDRYLSTVADCRLQCDMAQTKQYRLGKTPPKEAHR